MKAKCLILSCFIFLMALTCYAEILPSTDGALIYYEVKGNGKPLVFIHGWTMSGKFWAKQVDALSKDYQVIVMDLRGHGNSSKALDSHTIPQYAEDVRTLIETLELEDVALIGWSLAGSVVLEYWKQYGSDRVQALGIVDSAPVPFSPAEWNTHSLRNYNFNGMNASLLAFQEDRKTFAGRFINNMFKSGVASKEDVEWMMKEHLKTPTPVAVAIYSDYVMRDYSDVLKTIKIPTIVFAADSHIFKNGIEMGKYISSRIPRSRFIAFEKSGHLPFYEEPEKFNHSLVEFLKGASILER
ncbi:MAG: alpha/beta hydrolase [Proteobacteria bacterium]|nr:alpha/beta hydrolase [Pseudomonadota bacterium]